MRYTAALGCNAQINALAADDSILTGATEAAVVCGIVSVVSSVVLGDPIDIKLPSGSGGYCVKFFEEGDRDYIDVEFTFCGLIDPDVEALFGVRDVVQDGAGVTLGWQLKSESTGGICCPTGTTSDSVSIMIWHLALDGGAQVVIGGNKAWALHAFPKLKFDASSYTVTRNGEGQAIVIKARGYKNAQWGQGPGTSTIFPDAAGLLVEEAEWLTTVAPPLGCSCSAATSGLAAQPLAIA